MGEQVLALDVGGTNTRIALIEIKYHKPIIRKRDQYETQKITNISKVIKKFKSNAKTACIGFAGPIVGDKAKLTNAKLTINLPKIKKEAGLKEVSLINDFSAAGYGIHFLKKTDISVLNTGKFENDVEMVVGPGTGLGKAYIINKKVYPCEAGFTALGVEDIDDYALLDYIKGRYGGLAYYEDVVSGRGFTDIYDHLEIKSNMDVNLRIRRLIQEEPVFKAKIIAKYASKDKLCDMTLRIFTKFYARFVRDNALSLITSKVYLVGGITNAIRPYLKKSFMKEFCNHRKYKVMLKKVGIYVVTNQDVGLIGAGAVAGNLV